MQKPAREMDNAGQASGEALERMRMREEVLQICYWYQGEGLGDTLNHRAVQPFLNAAADAIGEAFRDLERAGDMTCSGDSFAFTEQGKTKAARMFADTFTEFQMAAHYECTAGCCDGEEVCEHDHHAHGASPHHG